MLRWGIALAAVGLLGLATQARAQVPAGGNGLKFAPIDTTRNVATPVPVPIIPQGKLSTSDKVHNALASVVPFVHKRNPTLPAPQGMATKLPKQAQAQQSGPLSKILKLAEMPKISQVLSGGVK